MRDDKDGLALFADAFVASGQAQAATTNVIPFRARAGNRPLAKAVAEIAPATIARLLDTVSGTLAPRSAAHAPTQLAALGALVGFAAQQSLLVTGGAAWVQPARNGHLDRLLLSEAPGHASLWTALRQTARQFGCEHLPDPQKLLDATLRCVGTTQFGRITLPLEYQLCEQPQASLTALWPRVREALSVDVQSPDHWPSMTSASAARRVALDHRQVPVHVALRIVMQAALAMALIEPRLVPGAAVKPGCA